MFRPTDFKQNDKRWKDIIYAVDGETSTIGSAGCGPTAVSMVLNTLVSKWIDPVTCASWARMHGYKVYKSGTSYNFPTAIGKAYGVEIKRLTTSSIYHHPENLIHTEVINELAKGNWIIACMGKGTWTRSGHYILVYGYKDGNVYINDPASTKTNRAVNTWDRFKNEVKQYWIVKVHSNIKKNNEYNQADFVREVQLCIKAGCDEKAGPITLRKTPTVSRTKNRKHAVVYVLQKKLKYRGYYAGDLDRVAGPGFDSGVKYYQKYVVGLKNPDGELTSNGATWKSLLK